MIDYVGKIAEKLLRERGAYTMEELKGEINFEFARISEALDEALDVVGELGRDGGEGGPVALEGAVGVHEALEQREPLLSGGSEVGGGDVLGVASGVREA